jgi:hypothetical protein
VGVLPCGNVDPARLEALEGAARTRYARAAQYHTAFVMGFLCATSLLPGAAPPLQVAGPSYSGEGLRCCAALVPGDGADWQAGFDRLDPVRRRALTPMICGLALTSALRRRDMRAVHQALVAADRFDLPPDPLRAAATDLLATLQMAVDTSPVPS